MKLGIAFSGGGARGFAHLGIMQAFYEEGIKPHIISGTSAGSIAGSFLAAGYEPKEAMEIISGINFLKYFRPATSWRGLIKLERISGLLEEYFPENSFAALKTPLTVTATNFSKGQITYFSEGQLILPMLASASIPVIFDPVKIGDNAYVDGGILNNLPVEPLLGRCDFIIGINTNPVSYAAEVRGMKEMLERTMLMTINYNAHDRIKYCNIFYEPPALTAYKVFSVSKASEIFEKGYEFAKQKMENDPETKGFINHYNN